MGCTPPGDAVSPAGTPGLRAMTTIPYYLTIAAVASVAAVLVMGLATLLRGTSPNRSQMLMRWRIGLQFIAIVVILLTIYLTRR